MFDRRRVARAHGLVMCALLGGSSVATAAGVGMPPPANGEYTPGRLGPAQLVSPSYPGYYSTVPLTQGCSWAPTYGDTGTQNYAYPESNVTYWQASPPLSNPAGTRIRIDGQFANARYFSISLYNGLYQLLGTFNDYQLVTDANTSPFPSKTQVDSAVSYGQSYTAYVVFGPPPPQPAPNTLYVPPTSPMVNPQSTQRMYLLYRVYVPGGVTASGDVPLPALSINGKAFSSLTQSVACQNLASELEQNALVSILKIPTLLAPAQNPPFTVYKDLGLPGLDSGVNGANQYLSAKTTLPASYVYLIRGQAPKHASNAGVLTGSAPDVRYWSICQNTTTSQQVVGCVGDSQAVLDSGGFYDIVVSDQLSAPPHADAAHGFNWMPFGPQTYASVIYRQMLADDNFVGAIGKVFMGSFTPKIAYCPISLFETLVSVPGNPPEMVFKGCGG